MTITQPKFNQVSKFSWSFQVSIKSYQINVILKWHQQRCKRTKIGSFKLVVMMFHHIKIVGFGFNGLKVATQIDWQCQFPTTCCKSCPRYNVATRVGCSVTPSILTRPNAILITTCCCGLSVMRVGKVEEV